MYKHLYLRNFYNTYSQPLLLVGHAENAADKLYHAIVKGEQGIPHES